MNTKEILSDRIKITDSSVDDYVGSRIKMRRAIIGYSQEKLAEELGITFQQVQKYERGLNRVSAGRLWQLAKVLDVSVGYFFEGFEQSKHPYSGGMLNLAEDSPVIEDNVFARKDVLELLRYYISIPNAESAKIVLNLAKHFAAARELPGEDNE